VLLWHGSSFWAWGLFPGLAFGVDHWLRFSRQTHRTQIVSASALRSAVTRLEIARPSGFVHRPTDYMFVRIPEIAKHEWHPFTISSAPQREQLGLHIRKLGNWTGQLHALIESGRALRVPALDIELDGPYGARCTHIFEARHAVLIGAGIGATPFAGVLESLALDAQQGKQQGSLQHVHFLWINRDQHGCSRRSSAWTRARSSISGSGRPDLVTGLKARTRMGHPNFMDELGAIAKLHAPEPVSVFFCGPAGLARKVRAACSKLDLDFRQEHF
jgi:predicted ferric reductase